MSKTYGPLSLNEVLFFFTRATVGAGAPFGIGEDTAKAAIFLAECNLDPGPIISLALKNLDRRTSQTNLTLRSVGHNAEIEASDDQPVSAVFAGPAAADWLSSQNANSDVQLRIRQVDCPILIAAICHKWAVSVVDQTGMSQSASNSFTGPADAVITSGQSDFISRRDNVLMNGVNIDIDAWNSIHGYFTRCLVPSTAESRIAGAGAGLVDTD